MQARQKANLTKQNRQLKNEMEEMQRRLDESERNNREAASKK